MYAVILKLPDNDTSPFELGEVFDVDDSGVEVGGAERRLADWSLSAEFWETEEAALERGQVARELGGTEPIDRFA